MDQKWIHGAILLVLIAAPVLTFVYLNVRRLAGSDSKTKAPNSEHYWRGFWAGGLVILVYLLALNWLGRQIMWISA